MNRYKVACRSTVNGGRTAEEGREGRIRQGFFWFVGDFCLSVYEPQSNMAPPLSAKGVTLEEFEEFERDVSGRLCTCSVQRRLEVSRRARTLQEEAPPLRVPFSPFSSLLVPLIPLINILAELIYAFDQVLLSQMCDREPKSGKLLSVLPRTSLKPKIPRTGTGFCCAFRPYAQYNGVDIPLEIDRKQLLPLIVRCAPEIE